MSAIPSPTQSEQLSKGSLPVKQSLVEVLTVDPADLKNDQLQSERPWLGKRVPLAVALITFCIGVAATSAWQSYGDAAREMIARSSPRLGWLAPQAAPVARNAPHMSAPTAPATPSPDQQQLNAMSLDLDAVRQSVDRIVASQQQMTRNVDWMATSIATSQEQMTRSVDQLATSIAARQEQITRSVDQLTAGQEQMTREITKLQEIEQSIRYKNSEPSPRPASAPKPVPRPASALAPKPLPRPSPAPTVP